MKSDSNDYELRHQVVQTGFSAEDDRIYDDAMATIRERLAAGNSWKKVCQELEVADRELKDIILDDFLKINIAQRHFQGGDSLKKVAKEIGVPLTRLTAAKEEMIKEVKKASTDAYHLTQKMQEEEARKGKGS